MRKNIVAGNWKMNKTLQEGVALATELKNALATMRSSNWYAIYSLSYRVGVTQRKLHRSGCRKLC